MNTTSTKIVSSEDECLILVDENDQETGILDKAACHDGDGVLHRAFSIFLFNDRGELLLQRRAAGKRLWPMFWSNSCCSHPRNGESVALAAERRLDDELHVSASLHFVYKFAYQAKFEEVGSEHELCHVFLGRLNGEATRNETEIDALRYVSSDALEKEFASTPGQFTPWFRMEWQQLKKDFGDTLARYTSCQAGSLAKR